METCTAHWFEQPTVTWRSTGTHSKHEQSSILCVTINAKYQQFSPVLRLTKLFHNHWRYNSFLPSTRSVRKASDLFFLFRNHEATLKPSYKCVNCFPPVNNSILVRQCLVLQSEFHCQKSIRTQGGGKKKEQAYVVRQKSQGAWRTTGVWFFAKKV